MVNPKTQEEALDNILTTSKEPVTQATAARGLALSEEGRKILGEHVEKNDLPVLHASIPNILAEAEKLQYAAQVAEAIQTPSADRTDGDKAERERQRRVLRENAKAILEGRT